jgi:hypothetical protein
LAASKWLRSGVALLPANPTSRRHRGRVISQSQRSLAALAVWALLLAPSSGLKPAQSEPGTTPPPFPTARPTGETKSSATPFPHFSPNAPEPEAAIAGFDFWAFVSSQLLRQGKLGWLALITTAGLLALLSQAQNLDVLSRWARNTRTRLGKQEADSVVLASLRKRLLLAKTSLDLAILVHEVDSYLLEWPQSVDAKHLRQTIMSASMTSDNHSSSFHSLRNANSFLIPRIQITFLAADPSTLSYPSPADNPWAGLRVSVRDNEERLYAIYHNRRIVRVIGCLRKLLMPGCRLSKARSIEKFIEGLGPELAATLLLDTFEQDEILVKQSRPEIAIRLSNIAGFLCTLGYPQEAEQVMYMAVEIFNAALGAEHAESETACGNYIALLKRSGFSDEEITSRTKAFLGS